MKDPTQTDVRLWLIFSGGLAGVLVAAVLVVSRSGGGMGPRDIQGTVAGLLLGLSVPCAVVGWFAQLVVTSCGFRLSPRPRPEQAADYDDRPPTP